jgi:hypothetical protein
MDVGYVELVRTIALLFVFVAGIADEHAIRKLMQTAMSKHRLKIQRGKIPPLSNWNNAARDFISFIPSE